PVPSGRTSMSQPAISCVVAGLPKPNCSGAAAIAISDAPTVNAKATPSDRSKHLDIADLAGRIDAPCLDGVVVINRAGAAHGAQLPDGRLHVASLVDHARLRRRRAAIPRPIDAKARERLGQHRLRKARRAPVAATVGRDIDPLDLSASRPWEPGDFVITPVEQHLPAGGRRDDALRFVDPRVLAVL